MVPPGGTVAASATGSGPLDAVGPLKDSEALSILFTTLIRIERSRKDMGYSYVAGVDNNIADEANNHVLTEFFERRIPSLQGSQTRERVHGDALFQQSYT
jgi:hypothetical protein